MDVPLRFFSAIFLAQLLQALLVSSAEVKVIEVNETEIAHPDEGDDILYTPEQLQMLHERKAISNTVYRWTEVNGFPQVPYRFADGNVNQAAVESAIEHWKEHTCLTFHVVSSSYSSNHIYFQYHNKSCNSYVGMVKISNSFGQPINVPTWCSDSFGSLVHEIGHAIGLFHEQSRSDRDDYVRIITQNIDSSNLHNFNLDSDNNYSVPYDYNSDMHYSSTAASINGGYTIETVNPLYVDVIGQRLTGLSHMDKLIANRMYSCIDKNLATCSLSTDPCQNNGYMGKTCSCICPFGTSGSNCETKTASPNDENLPQYSEKITTEGTVSSTHYPSGTPKGTEKYKKWIVAPTCKLVKATFQDFFVDACSDSGTFIIRTDQMLNGGSGFCVDQITAGQSFTSVSNQMLFDHNYSFGNSVWSATITFENDPSCPPAPVSTTTSPATSTTPDSTTTATPSTTSTTPVSTTTATPSTTSTTPVSTTTATESTTSTTPVSTTTATESTTSTTPVSTTITTPTSTTPATPAAMHCPSRYLTSGRTDFWSPNYPRNYPNNAMCVHENKETAPSLAHFYFSKFKVKPGDYLLLEHRYGPPIKMKKTIKKPRKTNPLKFPANFKATFISNKSRTSQGFNVRYTTGHRECHKAVKVRANRKGSFKTPRFPKGHRSKTMCEWKFSTTPGSRIKIQIFIKKVKCKKNYVAIDKMPGDSAVYDSNNITSLCGKKRRITVFSTTNEISVFYYGRVKDKGFSMSYSVV